MEEKKFKAFLDRNKLDHKPFQAACFQWCYKREQPPLVLDAPKEEGKWDQRGRDAGGILALEMGLGKTIVMCAIVKCNIKPYTLIILPRSLLDQWEKNIIHLCACKPLVYHGSRPKNMKMTLAEIKAASQIVITTYGQMSLPSEKQLKKGRKKSLLHSIVWNRIICDEAHHVSHRKTNEYNGIQALNYEICWLVTGTPIQNSPDELFNLFSHFGLPWDWKYYYSKLNPTVYTDTAKKYIYHSTKAGAGIVLPKLTEHTIKVEWKNDAEREFGMHIHSLLSFCNVPQKPIADLIEKETEKKNALRMKYLARAQQVCAYPPMLPHTIANFETMLCRIQPSALTAAYGELDLGELSASQSKLDAVLKTLLERKDNGCGKIVFCKYYAEIDAIEKRLQNEAPTLRIAKFDGRVPNGKRAAILNTPADILLAQIKMCREGLNLQDNYSEAYLPSPHFNPATEQQAIARCWRIGQKKEVHVFRYIQTINDEAAEAAEAAEADEADEADEAEAAEAEAAEAEAQPDPPQTMDMFAVKLHKQKQIYVKIMTDRATSYAKIT